MSNNKVRLPNGEVVERGELEHGEECCKCGAFLPGGGFKQEVEPDVAKVSIKTKKAKGNRKFPDYTESGPLCYSCLEGLLAVIRGDATVNYE